MAFTDLVIQKRDGQKTKLENLSSDHNHRKTSSTRLPPPSHCSVERGKEGKWKGWIGKKREGKVREMGGKGMKRGKKGRKRRGNEGEGERMEKGSKGGKKKIEGRE